MVVVVRELVQEGAWLQDEGGQHHLGQVHARPKLLQQGPHQSFILLRNRLCLGCLSCLKDKFNYVHTLRYDNHCIKIGLIHL